jgi:hypothetical protein
VREMWRLAKGRAQRAPPIGRTQRAPLPSCRHSLLATKGDENPRGSGSFRRTLEELAGGPAADQGVRPTSAASSAAVAPGLVGAAGRPGPGCTPNRTDPEGAPGNLPHKKSPRRARKQMDCSATRSGPGRLAAILHTPRSTKRSHECERCTHECVRHNGSWLQPSQAARAPCPRSLMLPPPAPWRRPR